MPRRSRRVRRSGAEWSVRGLLALLAALLGYVSVTRTLAYSLRTHDVQRAHALSPRDGRISGLFAQKLAGPDATRADRMRADRLAQAALGQDPTVVPAVVTLGIDAQLRGDTPGTRQLFAYAQQLSRRDLETQIWIIEDAVTRGDIFTALKHYDIALRTSRNAPDLLFPVLAGAIAVPEVRDGLIRTLAAKPSWGDAFLLYVAAKGPDSRATARLLTELRQVGLVVPERTSAEIVNLLIFGDFLDDAWAYYATIRPSVDRRRSRDPGFDAGVADPSPFDWTPVSEAGIVASIQPGNQGGFFDFAAPTSIGGPVLRQMQVLAPGGYRLEGRSSGIEQPRDSLPFWTLTCRDGRELGRIIISNSSQGDGRFTGRFDVPTGCPMQTLTLVARASDMVSGASGHIDRVQLYPAS